MLHHDPGHVTAVLLGAAVGVVVIVALVVVRPRVERRVFAGPAAMPGSKRAVSLAGPTSGG
jgi:hypothetical protein